MALRSAAQKQADAANLQLKIAQDTFKDLQEERERASHPYFMIVPQSNGPYGDRSLEQFWTLNITNKGAPVYWVKVKAAQENGFSYAVTGTFDYVEKDQKFQITFRARGGRNFPDKWDFEISYITLLHRRKIMHYRADGFHVHYLDSILHKRASMVAGDSF